jgi:DNA-binding NtrC family response regulator
MAIEHSPESDCILRGISTQATYFMLQRPHFSKLLSPRAARVVVAVSLRQAKEALSLEPIGIIFCDESLSGGSYRELLSMPIKANELKLVLLLRLGDWPEYLEAMREGAFDVLCCPLRPAEVENVLLRAITDDPTAPRKSSPKTNIVAATLIL